MDLINELITTVRHWTFKVISLFLSFSCLR